MRADIIYLIYLLFFYYYQELRKFVGVAACPLIYYFFDVQDRQVW
jgi:hypothetical protein